MTTSSKTALSRRRFVAYTSQGALLAGGLALGPVGLWPDWAMAEPDFATALLRMGRDIYPHDAIDDRYYLAPLRPLLDAEKAMMKTGLANLDKLARDAHSKSYVEIVREDDRTSLLRLIQHTEFFQKVRNTLVVGLYNNHELWEAYFGYEGSSWEKGGYLQRGFDNLEIDWL